MKMQVTFLAFMLYFKSASRLPRKQNFLRWNPLNIINVESPFQMGNWEAVADVDVVHDGPIPSQTIHLDFEPIYLGTHNEGFSQTFPTASYWEQSEPKI
jgi:hypothetical protein